MRSNCCFFLMLLLLLLPKLLLLAVVHIRIWFSFGLRGGRRSSHRSLHPAETGMQCFAGGTSVVSGPPLWFFHLDSQSKFGTLSKHFKNCLIEACVSILPTPSRTQKKIWWQALLHLKLPYLDFSVSDYVWSSVLNKRIPVYVFEACTRRPKTFRRAHFRCFYK